MKNAENARFPATIFHRHRSQFKPSGGAVPYTRSRAFFPSCKQEIFARRDPFRPIRAKLVELFRQLSPRRVQTFASPKISPIGNYCNSHLSRRETAFVAGVIRSQLRVPVLISQGIFDKTELIAARCARGIIERSYSRFFTVRRCLPIQNVSPEAR